MRVLLIATNREVEPYPVFPLGMAVIASTLSSAGHEVRQWDCLTFGTDQAALRSVCDEFRPQVVGFSVRNVDNVDSLTSDTHWALHELKEMISTMRSCSDAPFLMGGPGFSVMPEQILDYTGADFGVVGEGEIACLDVLEKIENGLRPPRITRGERRLEGKEMRGAAPDPEIMKFYLGESGIAGIQTKRGCPHACVYCTYPALEGTQIRARDPREVVDEIERLVRDFEVGELFFTDSVFNDRHGHWLALAEEMARREMRIPWSAFFQPTGMTRETLRLCRRAGLKALELGTDASTDATLNGLRKGFDFAEAKRVNDLCVSERLPCAHFIIFGGPGETPTTVEEGVANLDRLRHCVAFIFLGIRIYPRTALMRHARQEGVIDAAASCLEPTYYFSPSIDPAALEVRLDQAFKGRRDRIFPPSRGQLSMTVMRKFGHRGILWDTLIRYSASPERDVAHV
jgi:lipid biosynthesis B12-binding/radical SAM protein